MTAVTLYTVAAEYRQAADKLADLDLDEQTLSDSLEGLSGDLEVKAQNVAFVLRNIESVAAAKKEAAATLLASAKTIERRAEWLRHYIKTNMQIAGVFKLECPYFRIAIQNNPQSVDVYEPGLVPIEYMRQPEPQPATPDKKAIAEAIKAGQEVPGCQLVQTQRLVIA